jgi:hypothetical protein
MPKDKNATKPRVTFGLVTQIIGFFLLLEASLCNSRVLSKVTTSSNWAEAQYRESSMKGRRILLCLIELSTTLVRQCPGGRKYLFS